ncbi:LysR family transcriptional regulator [Vibrio fluvialis]|uniref:LysR family transcriptional regulator n=1 Tax=Vibrio fluvialis TaxID=676 RepID=UPI001EEC6944|nr:LysR family transcriptional regulator [Vibrio fluvialis]MCG6366904.1 LysR substrate-binding domain-containing protein [Vibrio fluvialis]
MDKISAMRAFTTVVSEGNFVKAAERLDLSPQLVSKYVAQLEETLKVRLLNRTTRRVNLTEAGQAYFERCQQVLQDIDDMENALSNLQSQVSGTLRVSAPMSFGVHHLSKPVALFQDSYPDVKVELLLTDRKVDLLDEGVDIALRIGHLKDSALVAKKITPIHLSICAAPHYWQQHGKPTQFEALSKLNYLRFTYSDPRAWFRDWPKHVSIHDFASDFSSNNGDVIVNAALLGRGYVIQPTFLTGAAIKRGDLEVLSSFALEPLGLYALYSHREFLASKVRHFIDFLSSCFGDVPYWDR